MFVRGLPVDFDSGIYALLNPDLPATRSDPGEHYLTRGLLEGRRYKRSGRLSLSSGDRTLLRRIQKPSLSTGRCKAAVFVHYDPNGVIEPYVIHALMAYRAWFDRVLFLSTSALSNQELDKVRPLVASVLVRQNEGYDFMSWRVGWHLLSDLALEDVTFINDSVYGPHDQTRTFLFEMSKSRADLWGASLSREVRPHVQSYFMRFGPRLLKSGFAARFWGSVGVIADKPTLIRHNEVGLSALVERSAFTIGGLVDFGVVSPETRQRALRDNQLPEGSGRAAARDILSRVDPNPLQLYWKETLRLGNPFVKIELLKTNPLDACRPAVVDAMRRLGYDPDLITGHLRATMPPGAYAILIEELAASDAGLARGFG